MFLIRGADVVPESEAFFSFVRVDEAMSRCRRVQIRAGLG